MGARIIAHVLAPKLRGASLLALLLAVTRCGGTGTDLNQLVSQSPFLDGGAEAANAEGGASVFQDPFTGAPSYAAQTGPSSHNAGQSCIQSGCHATSGGGEAPSFLVGGTVYADYAGHTPAVGVEVRVVDTQGHAVSAFSGSQGNFYVRAESASGFTFPIAVGARSATATRPMITPLATGQESCGQGGCHVPGGGPTTTTGNYYPIHTP